MNSRLKKTSHLEWEKAVVRDMIHLYCTKKHGTDAGTLCAECQELLDYSHNRLDRCRYGEEKPTCRKCPTHCYRPAMREKIKDVMRFSGPRFFFRSPLRWIIHAIHDRKKVQLIRERIESEEKEDERVAL